MFHFPETGGIQEVPLCDKGNSGPGWGNKDPRKESDLPLVIKGHSQTACVLGGEARFFPVWQPGHRISFKQLSEAKTEHPYSSNICLSCPMS